jgi:hypothetical protein
MSQVYPTTGPKPWFKDRVRVHTVLKRDVFGKVTKTEYQDVPANVTIQNLEMREAGGRAQRQAIHAKVPDATNIKNGSIVTFDGVDYTITSVIGKRDHRGVVHFWTIDGELKRGEQGVS